MEPKIVWEGIVTKGGVALTKIGIGDGHNLRTPDDFGEWLYAQPHGWGENRYTRVRVTLEILEVFDGRAVVGPFGE